MHQTTKSSTNHIGRKQPKKNPILKIASTWPHLMQVSLYQNVFALFPRKLGKQSNQFDQTNLPAESCFRSSKQLGNSLYWNIYPRWNSCQDSSVLLCIPSSGCVVGKQIQPSSIAAYFSLSQRKCLFLPSHRRRGEDEDRGQQFFSSQMVEFRRIHD